MGLLTGVIVGIVVVMGGVLLVFGGAQSSREFRASVPYTTRWMLARAVRSLPDDKRERYEEEWAAHLDQLTGWTTKWIAVVGFNLAAFRITVAGRWPIIASFCYGIVAISTLPFGLLSGRDTDTHKLKSLVGIAVTLALLIIGLFLVQELRAKSTIEDCLLSGRGNCESFVSSLR
jgi:hypothetical protein